MSNEKIDTGDLNSILKPLEEDPNFDEIMKNFRLNCPVKKINLVIEEPNVIVGMYCLSSKDFDLKSKADLNDLNDNTLLFFTNQHIVELSKILYGMLLLISENNGVDKNDISTIIANYCDKCRTILPYFKYKKHSEEIINKYFNIASGGLTIEVISKFADILNTIIFVPYNTIDDIAKAAIAEFKKNMEVDNNG